MKTKYDSLVELAKTSYDEGKLEDAIKYYEEAFKEKIDVRDYLMLGFIYIDTDHLNKALDIFNRIREVGDYFEVHFGLANIYERMGKINDAIEMYNMVIDEEPDFEMAYFNLAYIYDDIAEENKEDITDKNYSLAIKNYEKCIEINNENFWAHINVGSIFERFDYNDKALNHFLEAYKLNKNEKMVCYNLGVVYSKLKDFDKAKQFYLEELEKDEPYISTYYNLGIVYKDGYKDYNMAQYYYLMGLSKNKEDYNIWYNLGCVHALKKDFQNAFECFKYIYYKNKRYLNLVDTDEELEEFRKTEYYKSLINGLQ